MIKLSIIIPVYNAEKYLEECLDSVVKVLEDQVEVILINDGSLDKSEHICKLYSQKIKNIKYFKNINMGCSATRNFGIKKSKGRYITFLDSDDYFLDNLKLSQLLKIIEKEDLDILIYGYEKKGIKKSINFIPQNINTKEQLYNSTDFFNVPWNKIYNRKILNKVEFPLETHMGEDLAFNFIAFYYANKIKVINQKYYCYRDNIESVSYNPNKMLDIFKSFEYIFKYFLDKKLNKIEEKALINLYINNAVIEPYRCLAKLKKNKLKIDYNNIIQEKQKKQKKMKSYLKKNIYIFEKYGEIRFKYNKIFDLLKKFRVSD